MQLFPPLEQFVLPPLSRRVTLAHYQLFNWTAVSTTERYDLRTLDMDGDGDLDLLNAGRGTGNVAWYENPTK